jgi:hypothetical protein
MGKKNKKFVCESCFNSVKKVFECFDCLGEVCKDCLFFCQSCKNYFCKKCFDVIEEKCYSCLDREKEQAELEKAKKEGKFELICQICQEHLKDYNCSKCNAPVCIECSCICDECDRIVCENCYIIITYLEEESEELKLRIEKTYFYCKDCYFKNEE